MCAFGPNSMSSGPELSIAQRLRSLQIYVEIERARLTRKLAQLKEQEGNIAEAADVLQEVAVVCSHSSTNSAVHVDMHDSDSVQQWKTSSGALLASMHLTC